MEAKKTDISDHLTYLLHSPLPDTQLLGLDTKLKAYALDSEQYIVFNTLSCFENTHPFTFNQINEYSKKSLHSEIESYKDIFGLQWNRKKLIAYYFVLSNYLHENEDIQKALVATFPRPILYNYTDEELIEDPENVLGVRKGEGRNILGQLLMKICAGLYYTKEFHEHLIQKMLTYPTNSSTKETLIFDPNALVFGHALFALNAPNPLLYDNIVYPTPLHFFFSQGITDSNIIDSIIQSNSIEDAEKVAWKHVDRTWGINKNGYLLKTIWLSVTQDSDKIHALLNTNDLFLKDKNDFSNSKGRAFMVVRDALKELMHPQKKEGIIAPISIKEITDTPTQSNAADHSSEHPFDIRDWIEHSIATFLRWLVSFFR